MKQKKDFFIDSLHIFILTAFAFAQPLFDLLSKNTTFFVARQSEPVDVLLLVLILCVVIPALLTVTEALAGIFDQGGRKIIHYFAFVCILVIFMSRELEPENVIFLILFLCVILPVFLVVVKAAVSFSNKDPRKVIHYFYVACLIAVTVLPPLKKVQLIPGTVLPVLAVAAGMVFTVCYVRFRAVQLFLTVLAPSLMIFPGLFLFNSPVYKIISPAKGNTPTSVPVTVENPPPVVMVVFDGFNTVSLMNEERVVDPVRYPHFAQLAEESNWFRNATTVSDSTGTAVPAILTGNYPDPDLLPTSADHPDNIFTLLGTSYNLNVFEPVTRLCPKRLCEKEYIIVFQRIKSLLSDLSLVFLHILLPEDFTRNVPSISQNWKDFAGNALIVRDHEEESGWFDRAILATGSDRLLQFNKFTTSLDGVKKPSFNFLHIMLPHAPHKYLPSGKRYNAVSLPGALKGDKEEWSSDEWSVYPYYQRYLLQVGFVDKLLGELIDKLKSVGLYDRSLLIVTADHGVSYRPGDLRRPVSKTNYHDIMAIPLFIKLPQQLKGSVIDRNIETIDILPTIAETLNISIPWGIEGKSAFDTSLPERTEKVIYYDEAREKMTVYSELLEKNKYSTLDRKLSLFGSGLKTDGIFNFGPNSELIGSLLRELHVQGTSNITITLQDAHLFQNIDKDSSFVPVNIAGSIMPHQYSSLDLAVSVNGVIAAVARTFHNGKKDPAMFSVIVSESVLKQGNNRIEVFVVSGSTGQFHLARIKSMTGET